MTRVLVSALGQVDNIGDSVLRRGLLDALRPLGPLVVNVTGAPDSYVSGLGLRPEDEIVRTSAEWRRAIISGTREGCVYAFNSGEAQLDRRWGLTYLRLLPWLVLNRLRGGSVLHLGYGLRAPHGVWGRCLRLVLSACDVVTWRDADSRRWVGQGHVQPDWAYLYTNVPVVTQPARRDVLAVSVRGDRPAPGKTWLRAVGEVARDLGLRVVAVPQVRRDTRRARELADELGGDVLHWHGEDHATNEARVRAVYRRSIAVVSDRLHALIIGHTEGAVPVGFGTDDVGKLERTLGVVGLEHAAFSERDMSVERAAGRIRALVDQRADVLDAALDARQILESHIVDLAREHALEAPRAPRP